MSTMTDKQAAVRLQRTIPAPPDRVYRAWLDPELLRRWMAPSGADVTNAEVDERVGGGFRIWHSGDSGFEGELLERVVDRITSNPRVWLKVMMSEELGLSAQFARPYAAATVMFVSFVVGGVVPVVPFLFATGTTALLSAFAATAVALLAAGAFRTWLPTAVHFSADDQ